MTRYGRNSPCPEYRDIGVMYERLQEVGETSLRKSRQDTFMGKMLVQRAPGIKEMIARTGSHTILDCGAGYTDISYRLVTSTTNGLRKKFSFARNRRKQYQTVERMA